MTTAGTTQTFSYVLAGVDPACSGGAGDAANSCGVHVHSGTSCSADALGHFFKGDVKADPWATLAYVATAQGTTAGSETVETGATQEEVEGLTFIVHAYDGSRIACAILQPADMDEQKAATSTAAAPASVSKQGAKVTAEAKLKTAAATKGGPKKGGAKGGKGKAPSGGKPVVKSGQKKKGSATK